jgi:hypothetical protein
VVYASPTAICALLALFLSLAFVCAHVPWGLFLGLGPRIAALFGEYRSPEKNLSGAPSATVHLCLLVCVS